MSAPQTTPKVRRSVSLPPDLVRQAMEAAPPEHATSFNRVVVAALHSYVAQQRQRELESALWQMADDESVVRECRAINREFAAAEYDGLDDEP